MIFRTSDLAEKTGTVDLAETAISVALYGIPFDLDMKKLYAASKLVEEISNIPISPLKPVVECDCLTRLRSPP